MFRSASLHGRSGSKSVRIFFNSWHFLWGPSSDTFPILVIFRGVLVKKNTLYISSQFLLEMLQHAIGLALLRTKCAIVLHLHLLVWYGHHVYNQVLRSFFNSLELVTSVTQESPTRGSLHSSTILCRVTGTLTLVWVERGNTRTRPFSAACSFSFFWGLSNSVKIENISIRHLPNVWSPKCVSRRSS